MSILRSVGKRLGIGLSREEKESAKRRRASEIESRHQKRLTAMQRRLELTQRKSELQATQTQMEKRKLGVEAQKAEVGLKRARIQKVRQQAMPRMTGFGGRPSVKGKTEPMKMPTIEEAFFPSRFLKQQAKKAGKARKKHKKKKRYRTIKVPY